MGGGDIVPKIPPSGNSSGYPYSNSRGRSSNPRDREYEAQEACRLYNLAREAKETRKNSRVIKHEKYLIAQLHFIEHNRELPPSSDKLLKRLFSSSWGVPRPMLKISFWDKREKIFVIQFENREDKESVLRGSPWVINGAPITVMPWRPEMTTFADMRMPHPPGVFEKGPAVKFMEHFARIC